MDTNEAEGFFPERLVLRARRLRATVDEPVDPSAARTRRWGIWGLWVAVFLPMFVNAITSGGHGHLTPRSMELIKYFLWSLLATCAVLASIGIWRNFSTRASN